MRCQSRTQEKRACSKGVREPPVDLSHPVVHLLNRPEGPIKTFPLRGIKDSPPYLHDGRLPTLHDTVEFFNLVLELNLTKQEKEDLVAYLLCL